MPTSRTRFPVIRGVQWVCSAERGETGEVRAGEGHTLTTRRAQTTGPRRPASIDRRLEHADHQSPAGQRQRTTGRAGSRADSGTVVTGRNRMPLTMPPAWRLSARCALRHAPGRSARAVVVRVPRRGRAAGRCRHCHRAGRRRAGHPQDETHPSAAPRAANRQHAAQPR